MFLNIMASKGDGLTTDLRALVSLTGTGTLVGTSCRDIMSKRLHGADLQPKYSKQLRTEQQTTSSM